MYTILVESTEVDRDSSRDVRGNKVAWLSLSMAVLIVAIVFSSKAVANAGDTSVAPEFHGQTFAKLSEEEKAILLEYRENCDRLKRFYNNITIEAHEEILALARSADGVFPTAPGADLTIDSIRDYVFRGNGTDYYRIDGVQYDVSDLTKTSQKIGVISLDSQYVLERNLATGKYFLRLFSKNRSAGLERLSSYVFHAAPFSFLTLSLREMLLEDREGCVIDRVELVQDAGEELVAVSRSYRHDDRWAHAVYRFYRNRSWAVKDIHHEGTNRVGEKVNKKELSVIAQRCSYAGEENGVPLLKDCVIEHFAKEISTGETRPLRRQVVSISNITPGPAALSYFDVDAMLGETKVGEQRPFPWPRVLAVVLSIVLIVVGIFLKRRQARARA